MLSLYLHIPFCQSKCKYCAFSSFPIAEKGEEVESYIQALKMEIAQYAQDFPSESIKTIYFGGGTPNLLGAESLIELISTIEKYFDCSELGELSFEFNPYPEEEIYYLVQTLQKKYTKRYPRIRFSFGIQSFDNEVLNLAGRKSSFHGLVDFLRGLQPLKQDNSVFNFDFIAFGKRNKSKKGNSYLWTSSALEFFSQFVNANFADSFSLYALELFENQLRKRKKSDHLISGAYFGTDEEIYEEFDLLKNILLEAGYRRYEISNFSLLGKSGIHNRAYREMQSYLGLGLNAASFLQQKDIPVSWAKKNPLKNSEGGLRFQNTNNLSLYVQNQFLDPSKIQPMSKKDYLIESFFLGLRTDRGVEKIGTYTSILIPEYEKKLALYQEEGLLVYEDERVVLTDAGMDVFNSLATELMEEI